MLLTLDERRFDYDSLFKESLLLALAGAGLGAAILPETLIAAAPPAHPPCYAAIEGDPYRTIILARPKKRYLPRAVSIFREELQTFCSDIQKGQKLL